MLVPPGDNSMRRYSPYDPIDQVRSSIKREPLTSLNADNITTPKKKARVNFGFDEVSEKETYRYRLISIHFINIYPQNIRHRLFIHMLLNCRFTKSLHN